MSEAELSEYCRKKGLYPEQIKEWKGACISANADMASRTRDFKKEISREKKKGKELEKELKRKKSEKSGSSLSSSLLCYNIIHGQTVEDTISRCFVSYDFQR
jgi:transcriptional regulator of met regulon